MRIAIRPFVVVVVAAAFSTVAWAQTTPPLEPLPDVPPPPKLSNTTPSPDDDDTPRITIRQDESGTKVEEFRNRAGRVYAIRVTPALGKPYVLVDPDGRGVVPALNEIPAGQINGGVHPAQWTIFEW